MDRHKIILINFNEEKKYQFIIEDFTPDTKIFLTEHKLIYSSSYSLTFVLIADPREEYFSVHDLFILPSIHRDASARCAQLIIGTCCEGKFRRFIVNVRMIQTQQRCSNRKCLNISYFVLSSRVRYFSELIKRGNRHYILLQFPRYIRFYLLSRTIALFHCTNYKFLRFALSIHPIENNLYRKI